MRGRRSWAGHVGAAGFRGCEFRSADCEPAGVLNIDRDRAFVGVSPQQIQMHCKVLFGDRQVSLIYRPANEYEVILELAPQYQIAGRIT